MGINKKYNQLNLVYNKYKYHCLYLSNLTSSVTNGLVIVNFLALFILSKYFLEINILIAIKF